MALLRLSPPLFFLLLALTSFCLLISPASALDCASQKFSNNKVYANCSDLSSLNSSLHWNYDQKNSSLSIAFVAPPASPNGWIAWAINPTKTGMVGSQALIAFKDASGSMTVKTYNISGYDSVKEGKIAFDVTESSAEHSGGMMRIFATVKLPETMTEVNQVWQVGGSVMNGMPAKHEFKPDNLKATGKLQLAGKAESNGTAAGDAAAASPTAAAAPGSGSSGSASSKPVMLMCVILMVFGWLLIMGVPILH